MHPGRVERIGIVGAGTMGAGIALLIARAGLPVILVDPIPAALEKARDRIANEGDRVRFDSELSALQTADLVLEAVPEELPLKQRIFATLEEIVSPSTILATNTSALSVAEIGAPLSRRDRFLGLHFFNPPSAMKLVEVVRHGETSDAVLDAAESFVASLDKIGIRVNDVPGFVVNRVARPFYLEALRALEAGAADAASLDALARGAGFPMGPFALMDLIGIDVNAAVSQAVYDRLHVERLRPSNTYRRMIEAGTLGRKTGSGFFSYAADAGPANPATLRFPAKSSVSAVALLDPDRVLEPLAHNATRRGVTLRRVATPAQARTGGEPVVYDAYRFDSRDLDALRAPVAGIGILGPLEDQSVVEVTAARGGAPSCDLIAPFLAGGPDAIAVAERPGGYLGATVTAIINEATVAVTEGVASPQDVDTALRLGVRYPRGPFEWRDRIGAARVAAILEKMAGIRSGVA